MGCCEFFMGTKNCYGWFHGNEKLFSMGIEILGLEVLIYPETDFTYNILYELIFWEHFLVVVVYYYFTTVWKIDILSNIDSHHGVCITLGMMLRFPARSELLHPKHHQCFMQHPQKFQKHSSLVCHYHGM